MEMEKIVEICLTLIAMWKRSGIEDHASIQFKKEEGTTVRDLTQLMEFYSNNNWL